MEEKDRSSTNNTDKYKVFFGFWALFLVLDIFKHFILTTTLWREDTLIILICID